MADGPIYKGTKYINQSLSYHGIEAQIQKLEGFDAVFLDEMSQSMETAVGMAERHAKEDLAGKIKGVSTGQLGGTIFGKMLAPIKGNVMAIRGAIGAESSLKAFAQEVGRVYWNKGTGKIWYKKGKFFLYFGAQERMTSIQAEYQKANERIVNRLVVKE